MTHFEAYLLTRLDTVGILGLFMIFLGVIISFSSLVIFDDKKFFYRAALPLFILGVLIKTLTPTSKEAAFIYIAPAIVNNQDVQKTFEQVPELANLGLDYLKEVLTKKIDKN